MIRAVIKNVGVCYYDPGGGEILLQPYRLPLGPSQSPIQWLSGLFPDVKRSGHGVNHPTPSRPKVKQRVQLYLYFHSGPSWPVTV